MIIPLDSKHSINILIGRVVRPVHTRVEELYIVAVTMA